MQQTSIQCFLSLAETLSFTKTAENLFLSQQAVSKSISQFEKELQLKLFVRSTRTVRLTAEGEELYVLLSAMFSEFNERIAEMKRRQNPFALHVGYQNYISYFGRLRQALNIILPEYPEASMDPGRYSPPHLREMLVHGELDLIVLYRRFFTLDPEEFHILPLCEIQQYLMVSEDTILPEDDPLAAIRKMPFIIDEVDHETAAEFQTRVEFERARWQAEGETIITHDRDTAYSQAEIGMGFVVGTNISFLSVLRTLKGFPCGLPEDLIAVWRKNNARPIVSQYAHALMQSFSSGIKPGII